jgi:hypothetical protein
VTPVAGARVPSLLAAALVVHLGAGAARADVVVLLNGDRVTGRVTGSVARRVRVQTPYGVLVIPADKVERIRRDDGSEQVLQAAPAAAPALAPTPSPQPTTLVLVVTGASFWYAWEPKSAPADPSLRLQLQLDDGLLAAYTDVNLDPEDLPKAVVNSFVFSPERLFVIGGEGAAASAPVLAAQEIRLAIRVPDALAGPRRLRLAYQLNDAGSAAPRWRDVVVAGAPVTLARGGTTLVRLRQGRGAMQYGRQGLRGPSQMRGVETFEAALETEASPSP